MVSYQEALDIILKAIPVPETKTIPTKLSFGRVLAKDISLSKNFPDCRLSAIDGYAINDLSKTSFHVRGEVAAGAVADFKLKSGECAAVMTGAPVPDGTESVVRVEDCEISSTIVTPLTKLKIGDLINEIGSEAQSGTIIAKKGDVIDKTVYPTLFYAGIPVVSVFERPKIGMLLTGDELCDVDQTPEKGQVFNTNCYTLESIVRSIHLSITKQIEAKDNEVETQRAFEELAKSCDIIVSSGGVSMGQYDFVKKTFQEQDYEILIQKTKIKPGSPLMVAGANGKLFFGTPGYPAAFLTNCLIYLVPALKKASGRNSFMNQPIIARSTTTLKSKSGRRYLVRARIESQNGEWVATVPESGKTSHFLSFGQSNGLIILDEDTETVEAGGQVKCLVFDLELN